MIHTFALGHGLLTGWIHLILILFNLMISYHCSVILSSFLIFVIISLDCIYLFFISFSYFFLIWFLYLFDLSLFICIDLFYFFFISFYFFLIWILFLFELSLSLFYLFYFVFISFYFLLIWILFFRVSYTLELAGITMYI